MMEQLTGPALAQTSNKERCMPLGSFRLNGIARKKGPTLIPVVASGGTTSTYTLDGKTYKVHTFTTNGTFSVTTGGKIDFLLVAGGQAGWWGGSGVNQGGPGGSGGKIVNISQHSISAGSFSVTVGLGGGNVFDPVAGGSNNYADPGGPSTAFGYTASGDSYYSGSNINGTITTYEKGLSKEYGAYGGGAGAGGAGGDAASVNGPGGSGGSGYLSNISGTNVYYAGGGGGGSGSSTIAQGGSGGGGRGANYNSNGARGTDGLGGGGGGGFNYGGTNFQGKRGGNGVVIIRYQIA